MNDSSEQDEPVGVINTNDREYEVEYTRKMQEAQSQLKRIKTKRQAVDYELDGREPDLETAFSLFCAVTQAQIEAMDSFTAEDLKYRLQGFLEMMGLVGGTINTSYDADSKQVGARFSYTPEGAEAPSVSKDYTFQMQ